MFLTFFFSFKLIYIYRTPFIFASEFWNIYLAIYLTGFKKAKEFHSHRNQTQ